MPDKPTAIAVEPRPDYRDANLVIQGLIDFNAMHAGGAAPQDLLVTLRDEEGRVMGGLSGDTWVGWLQVHALWIEDGMRARGMGRALMAAAEQEAISRGCTQAFLETLSFQAVGFYEKLGYTVFSRLDGFPPGGARYALRKTLSAEQISA